MTHYVQKSICNSFLIFKTLNVIWKRQLLFQNSLKEFLSNTASTFLARLYLASWRHLYLAFTKKILLCILFLIFQFNCFHCFLFRIKIDKTVDSFLVTDIISKEHVSRLMKDSNPKFPSKYSSRISTSLLIYASSLLW